MNHQGHRHSAKLRGLAWVETASSGNRIQKGRMPETAAGANRHAATWPSAENSHTDNREGIPLHYRLLFSLAVMGVFMEWLLPLRRATAVEATADLLEIMLLSAAALLLWGSFSFPGRLQFCIPGIMIALTWLAACIRAEGWQGLGQYAAGIPEDAALLFSGQMALLSEDSRLLILVSGWGLLVSSVQQLALYRGSTTLFTAVTLGYLLVLDLGFSVKTMGDLLIAAGFLLWMQSMSSLLRLKEQTGYLKLPYARWGGFALSAAVFLTAAAWMGGQLYGARPASPITLQPLFSKLQDWAEGQVAQQPKAQRQKAGTTGYSSETGELGKPLTPGTEPVFTVTSSRPAYWRGESSAYYDGRRWIREGVTYVPLSLTSFPEEVLPVSSYGGNGTLRQQIKFAEASRGGQPLFSAGTVLNVEEVELADGSRLGYVLANAEKHSFRLPEMADSAGIAGYTVESVLPESDPAVLTALTGEDPGPVKSLYLQLPPGLPERVSALAHQLTATAASRYEAAEAVRNYLQKGYTYTLNTRVPPAGADFSDDFLFTTKQGYCVHFATAMTVLLRSSGIPARYIQGYGPGTPEAGSGPNRFTVTQGDAHAWVEVYFPGAGWVPFDPTPGAGAAAAGPAAPGLAASAPPQATPASAAFRADALPALPQAGGHPAAPAAAALLGLAAAWRWRRSLALLPAASRAGRVSRERQLRAAALAWRGLAARYGAPPPGVTAREYAASLAIEDAGLRTAVREFVRQWETLAYGGSPQALRTPARTGLVKPPSGAASLPAAAEAKRFISRCLLIIFRLT